MYDKKKLSLLLLNQNILYKQRLTYDNAESKENNVRFGSLIISGNKRMAKKIDFFSLKFHCCVRKFPDSQLQSYVEKVF